MDISPIKLLKDAIKAVPAVRYALGVAGIVAVVAIIKSFKIGYNVAIFGGLIVFIFMFVLLIFSSIAGSRGKKSLRLPALVLSWAFIILTISASFLLASSAFFRWPLDFQIIDGDPDRKDVSIEGIVITENKEPIIGATIWIENEVNFSARSKTGGEFKSTLLNVYLGKIITLRARCEGYTTFSEDREIRGDNEYFKVILKKI